MLKQRLLCVLATALFLCGCNLELSAPVGGSVVSLSGEYQCEPENRCLVVIDDDSFDEVFRAVPDEGFVFEGWRKDKGYLCGGKRGDCALATTAFGQNTLLTSILASDATFYLEPVFRDTNSYSISGTLYVSEGSFVDGDVNDQFAELIFNDTIESAQLVPSQVRIGGYATEQGAGSPGPMKDLGDYDDYYEVDLRRGQTITLFVADPSAGDLDLYLMDESGAIVDASLDTSSLEQLSIAQSGRYFVNVYVFSGASNYTLSISDSFVTSASSLSLGGDFKIGDAIVGRRMPTGKLASASAEDPAPELIQLSLAGPKASLSASGNPGRPPRQFQFSNPDLEEKWRTLIQIKQLRQSGDYRYAEPNHIVRPHAVFPNDERFLQQTHYQQINLPEAWEITRGSEDVIVAVLDSGVLLDHPDLQGKLTPGYDFISNTASSNDGDGIDPDPYDSGDFSASEPNSYHGTHVAGTVGAATNNGIGVAGAGWRTRIMPIRVLGTPAGTYEGIMYDIIQGVRYAAGLSNDSGALPPRKADIINMSLGFPAGFRSPAFEETARAVRGNGVVLVASAGNDSSEQATIPAATPGVISVSAVSLDNQPTWYTNYGATIDIAAPGGDSSVDRDGNGQPDGILSTHGDDAGPVLEMRYRMLDGTSMAAPHVAGVMALMKAVNPDLGPADFDRLLEDGALTVDLGNSGRDDIYGYGLIDALRAVRAARDYQKPDQGSPASLNVTPTRLSLTYGGQQLSVLNSGDEQLTVKAVTTSTNWLSVAALEVDEDGLGRYQVRARTAELSPGYYEGEILIESTAGKERIPVSLQTMDNSTADSVGIVYLLLLDQLGETVDLQLLRVEAGGYNYKFKNVPPGVYTLIAGSDMDQDDIVCDAGEACGGYLTLSDPSLLEIRGKTSGINFPLAFDTAVNDISNQLGAKLGSRKKGYRIFRQGGENNGGGLPRNPTTEP